MDGRTFTQMAAGRLSVIYRDCERVDLLPRASGLSYTSLLGLVPALAITLGVISLATPLFKSEISDAIEQAKVFIIQNLAVGSGEVVVEKLEGFLGQFDLKKLGFGGFFGLLLSLSLLLKQIELAFNLIWGIEKHRSLLKRFVSFWSFLSLASLGLCLFIAAVVDLDASTGFSGTKVFSSMQFHFSGVAFVTFGVGVFALAYKIIPNKPVPTIPALKGAFFASVLLLLVSKAYASFSVKLTSYQSIYGAFAAIPLFLIWLYILWSIILFGCLLSCRFEKGWNIEGDSKLKKNDEIESPFLDRILDSLSKSELRYLRNKVSSKRETR